MELNKTEHLLQLNEQVNKFPKLWEACQNDPANLNNLYTVLGEVITSLIAITDHLSSTATK